MLFTLLVAHSVSRSCKRETLGSGGHSWQKNKNEKIRDQTKRWGTLGKLQLMLRKAAKALYQVTNVCKIKLLNRWNSSLV